MGVSICLDWKYRDIQTIIMENEWLKMTIMPDLGAKIYQITYKPSGKDMLWHHPRLRPQQLPFHSVYDDTFFGGWDELYPNDMEEELNGEQQPDHGEIWTLPWQYRVIEEGTEEVKIKLWVETVISASRVEKWITIKRNDPRIYFSHQITNLGQEDQPFLWKLHAAMAIDEQSRVDMPAKQVYIEDFGPPRNGQTGISYQWPYVSDQKDPSIKHDMRKTLPITARVNEFQYATQLEAGWCALTHTAEKVGMGLLFDQEVLPSCWLFATYGGWRNLHTLILEPCSGYPLSVNEGVRQKTHQVLKAGERLSCQVTAILYEGLTEVTHIDQQGHV